MRASQPLPRRLAAEAAGADVIAAQGMEAGGHRGCFVAAEAERKQVGLFALLPAIADATKLPVIAAGGIADARGVAAAFALGAHAVAIGTGFLRCPEAKTHPAWADARDRLLPKTPFSPAPSAGVQGGALQRIMCSLRWLPRRLHQLPIRYNAD